jgi:hypothetical protein
MALDSNVQSWIVLAVVGPTCLQGVGVDYSTVPTWQSPKPLLVSGPMGKAGQLCTCSAPREPQHVWAKCGTPPDSGNNSAAFQGFQVPTKSSPESPSRNHSHGCAAVQSCGHWVRNDIIWIQSVGCEWLDDWTPPGWLSQAAFTCQNAQTVHAANESNREGRKAKLMEKEKMGRMGRMGRNGEWESRWRNGGETLTRLLDRLFPSVRPSCWKKSRARINDATYCTEYCFVQYFTGCFISNTAQLVSIQDLGWRCKCRARSQR